MTLKELRLDYKAKKNAFEGDPLNGKAEAAYLAAMKALDQAINATVESIVEQGKAADESKKATPAAAKKAEAALKAAEKAEQEAAIATKAAADKAEVEAKEAAKKAAQAATNNEPATGAVTENPNAEDELKKS